VAILLLLFFGPIFLLTGWVLAQIFVQVMFVREFWEGVLGISFLIFMVLFWIIRFWTA